MPSLNCGPTPCEHAGDGNDDNRANKRDKKNPRNDAHQHPPLRIVTASLGGRSGVNARHVPTRRHHTCHNCRTMDETYERGLKPPFKQADAHPVLAPDDPDLYRHIVASVSEYAISALDVTGRVVSWNVGAERIEGYAATEVVGQHFGAFYTPEDSGSGKPAQHLEVAALAGRMEDNGWRVRKDGSQFWANVVICPIRNDSGELIGFSMVTRDLSGRGSAEGALQDSEESFRLLVDSVKDYAIFLLDTEGRVASWNQGAERIKGYAASEIIGQSFTRFYPQEAIAVRFPQYELEVAAREGRFEDEGWRVRKDGSRFWANVVITALRDANDRLVGFAKVTRDLTARRDAEEQARRLAAEEAAHREALQRNEELARLNDRLEQQALELERQESQSRELAERLQLTNTELNAALDAATVAREAAERSALAVAEAYQDLDQFAYVASHDLKAPLRGIANLAQWIQDDAGGQLGAESLEHLRLLHGRVRRMEALIDGILAYSRAGRRLSAPEIIDTAALVQDVIELLALPADIRIELPDQMPGIEAERVPLQQVFMNLLGNAVKYSRAVRPDVLVRVGWCDRGDAVEFSVSDNGPGIAPEYHERIWGMFQTLAARDKVEGTGIGLSVVKKIIESRGGRVWLESMPDHGATFAFICPKVARRGVER
jgi:PAS domain S-box-containing protein